MKLIKQLFAKKAEKGSSSLLKELSQVKGVEREEIEKLYSKGLMEPETLKDLTLEELVETAGIRKGFARIVKEIVSRKGPTVPFEYKKVELVKLKKEKKDVQSKTEYVLKEIEKLKKEHGSLQAELETKLSKNEGLQKDFEELKEDGKNRYLEEKRVQDVAMFMIKEQKEFKREVGRYKEILKASKKELDTIKKEYLFTKGEGDYIAEKIDFLLDKLDIAIEGKGLKQDKLTSFLNELKYIRSNIVEIHKKSRVKFYDNK